MILVYIIGPFPPQSKKFPYLLNDPLMYISLLAIENIHKKKNSLYFCWLFKKISVAKF